MAQFDEALFEDDCILPFEMENREKVFVEDAAGRILVVRAPTMDEWHYFNLREQAKLDAEAEEAEYYRQYNEGGHGHGYHNHNPYGDPYADSHGGGHGGGRGGHPAGHGGHGGHAAHAAHGGGHGGGHGGHSAHPHGGHGYSEYDEADHDYEEDHYAPPPHGHSPIMAHHSMPVNPAASHASKSKGPPKRLSIDPKPRHPSARRPSMAHHEEAYYAPQYHHVEHGEEEHGYGHGQEGEHYAPPMHGGHGGHGAHGHAPPAHPGRRASASAIPPHAAHGGYGHDENVHPSHGGHGRPSIAGRPKHPPQHGHDEHDEHEEESHGKKHPGAKAEQRRKSTQSSAPERRASVKEEPKRRYQFSEQH